MAVMVMTTDETNAICVHNDEYEITIPKGALLFRVPADRIKAYNIELNHHIEETLVWSKDLDFQCPYIIREENLEEIEMF